MITKLSTFHQNWWQRCEYSTQYHAFHFVLYFNPYSFLHLLSVPVFYTMLRVSITHQIKILHLPRFKDLTTPTLIQKWLRFLPADVEGPDVMTCEFGMGTRDSVIHSVWAHLWSDGIRLLPHIPRIIRKFESADTRCLIYCGDTLLPLCIPRRHH